MRWISILILIISAAIYPAVTAAAVPKEVPEETASSTPAHMSGALSDRNSLSADTTTSITENLADKPSRPTRKLNLIEKIINYLDNANKPKPEKRFDFTIVGGPSYNEATSFQLAIMGAALYHSRMDSLTPVSNASLFVQGSLTGFYRVGLSGDHYGPEDRYRIHYCADFAHFPLKFWGIGYETESQDANETKYTELRSALWCDFQWRLAPNLYLGPSINFQYAKATKVTRPELWNGQDLRIFDYGLGLGFIFSFDTRDISTNASSGINLNFKQYFYPGFLKNRYAFSSSELTFGIYRQAWKSGVIAAQLHGMATYGDTPWSMLPTVDESKGIRGYFEGRYRDKNEADVVVEIRQHIWKRFGAVVWGGVGTVFHHFSDIRLNTLLPSYGIGVRWEFKKKVNVRVDYGFGKRSSAISLGLYETF